MREALFIKKNKDRWLKHQLHPPTDPDVMASNFTQLVDDLAYAKTFYPTSSVTRYINSQASGVYLKIYQNRKEDSNRVWQFWKKGLPLTIYRHRKPMLFALALFLMFFSIGFFLSGRDESVARAVLGDGYVEVTQDNIDKGNPFGIYEGGNPILSWLMLMVHNIRVSLIIFDHDNSSCIRFICTLVFHSVPDPSGAQDESANQGGKLSGAEINFRKNSTLHSSFDHNAVVV